MNWLLLHQNKYEAKFFNKIGNDFLMFNNFSNEVQLFDIRMFKDDRGSLCVVESKKDLPFDIKRIFYVFGTKRNISRGNHAHKTSKQFLVVLNGLLKVSAENRGNINSFLLSSSNVGLYLPPLTWSVETPIEDGTIYLVLTSEEYNESDYIHNYSDFIRAGDSFKC